MTENDIVVWIGCVGRDDAVPAQWLALLGADERREFRAFADATLARRFAYRRAFRRLALADATGLDASCIRIRQSDGEKPVLADPQSAIHFSASNSGQFAVVAIAHGAPVGVDVEVVRPVNRPLLAGRTLSPADAAALDRVPNDRRGEELLRAWTVKEAVVKLFAGGLVISDLPRIGPVVGSGLGDWVTISSEIGTRGHETVRVRTDLVHVAERGAVLISIARQTYGTVVFRDAGFLFGTAPNGRSTTNAPGVG